MLVPKVYSAVPGQTGWNPIALSTNHAHMEHVADMEPVGKQWESLPIHIPQNSLLLFAVNSRKRAQFNHGRQTTDRDPPTPPVSRPPGPKHAVPPSPPRLLLTAKHLASAVNRDTTKQSTYRPRPTGKPTFCTNKVRKTSKSSSSPIGYPR